MKKFKYGTGLIGSIEPGQKVTAKNLHLLPCGSVVRNGDGSRLIRLHGNLWLWCYDNAWCYDTIDNQIRRLDKDSTACHVAPVT